MRLRVKRLNQKQIEAALVKVDEAYEALSSIAELIYDNTRETSTIPKRFRSVRHKVWKFGNVLRGELGKRKRIEGDLRPR